MSRGLQLRAALVGDFDKEMAAGRQRVAFAARSAMGDQAEALKAKLRADVAGSSLKGGGRLANTWRARQYPNSGLNPAAVIRSTAPMIVEAFERGEAIRSARGAWLTIPNPKLRLRVKRSRGGRSIVAQYEAKFGKLRFVPIRADLALLVTDLGRSKSGQLRRATDAARRRGHVESTVVFFLVPQARMPRLLRGQTIRTRVERDFPAQFQKDFDRYLDQAERAPAQLTYQGPIAGGDG